MCEFLAKFAEGFSKNQLIGYFLILWALTFLFSAIYGFLDVADGYGSTISIVIDGLWSLADLGCAAVLGLLGVKFLHKQE
jgi:hypothetical protein